MRILFSALAIAVISSMAASYFAAMTAIPLYTTHFLKESKGASKGFLGWIQRGVDRVTNGYGNTLAWVLAHRRTVLMVTLVSLAVTGALFVGKIGAELFPRADAGSMRIDLRGPTGYRIEETTALAKKIEAKLREWIPAEDLKMIIMNAGVYYGYSAAFTPNSGTQDVFFNVEMTEERKHTSQYYAKIIRERLHKEFPEVEFGIELGGLLTSALNGGLLSPIDVQIGGKNHEQSAKFAEELASEIKNVRGAVDVRVQQKFDAPQFHLDVDRKRALDLGLTPDEVVKNVVSAVSNSSTYNPAIWIDPKTGIDYLFGVQFPESTWSSVDDLMEIPITSKKQERSVLLKTIANVSEGKGPIELNHKDLQPVVDIYLDAQGRDIAGVSNDVQKIINKKTVPPGSWIDIRGEIAEMKNAVGSLGGGFLLAAVLVYLILVVQFRSFLLPAIVMTTVPMGMVGVIVILALWPTYFSIQAAIGCIFVIGVAVSHGVLLIEYILECSKHESNVVHAILKGAKARLRPITMTSLASILGLMPMAFGMGQGAEANIPLGRAVIGGQILSTLLNFYIVPALFLTIYGFIKTSGNDPSEGDVSEIESAEESLEAVT